MRTAEEIKAEIEALDAHCDGYDTEEQDADTILAVGAHDALRWALGRAEERISDTLSRVPAEQSGEGK
jgi:hypothetical protein